MVEIDIATLTEKLIKYTLKKSSINDYEIYKQLALNDKFKENILNIFLLDSNGFFDFIDEISHLISYMKKTNDISVREMIIDKINEIIEIKIKEVK